MKYLVDTPGIKAFAELWSGAAGLPYYLIDHSTQAEVEVWRYARALLSDHPSMVDRLSLIAYMQSTGEPSGNLTPSKRPRHKSFY